MPRQSDLVELMARYAADLPAYAATQLKISDKEDRLIPFRFNTAQRILHAECERQLSVAGWVRIILLKARQMGQSTYVAGRFFHKAVLTPDKRRAYILAHDDKTAKKLLRMYSTFHEMHDQNLVIPRTRANDHEQAYANGSLVEVNTASTPSGGRGGTVTLFHGSEVAFWQHAEAHAMGSMEQVGKDRPGTEMILESTADGASGAFYERWRTAKLGRSSFVPVFLPWTIQSEYATSPPAEFRLSAEKPNDVIDSEVEYAAKHSCTMEQMYWRRLKIEDFGADGSDGALRFAQEYPVTDSEAFLGGSADSFIAPAVVEAARLRSIAILGDAEAHPLVMGLDPAPAHGQACSALVWRRGRVCYRIKRFRGLNHEQLALAVYEEFIASNAARICVDESEGTGIDVCTLLQRFSSTAGRVVGVRFGDPAQDRTVYANVRAEIWSRMAKWLANGASIPDETPEPGVASLAAELLAPRLKHGGEKRVQLEPKVDMRRRGIASPDVADALACTFVWPDPGNHAQVVFAPSDYSPAPPSHATFAPSNPDGAYVAPFDGGW